MSYKEALEGLTEVLMDEELGYYQGDWVAIVLDGDGYGPDHIGFLKQGYGSCSGCDEWEASNTIKDRLAIVQEMVDNIKWFDTMVEFAEWLEEDHRDQWWGNDDEFVSFLRNVREALGPVDENTQLYTVKSRLRSWNTKDHTTSEHQVVSSGIDQMEPIDWRRPGE